MLAKCHTAQYGREKKDLSTTVGAVPILIKQVETKGEKAPQVGVKKRPTLSTAFRYWRRAYRPVLKAGTVYYCFY